MNENYADHPKSITEIKADKSSDANDWAPRDVLISLLRRIDAGEIAPTALVVGWYQPHENDATYGYAKAAPSRLVALGIAAELQHSIYDGV